MSYLNIQTNFINKFMPQNKSLALHCLVYSYKNNAIVIEGAHKLFEYTNKFHK